MPVNETALVALVVGGLCVLLALRILWGQGIIGRFILMLFCLLLLAIGAGGIVGGLDLLTYHKVGPGQEVATIKIEKTGARQYRVTVVDGGGDSYLREIDGEQWQLAARVITSGNLIPASIEAIPLYRLDKLAALSTGAVGNDIADTNYPLATAAGPVDLWLWLTGKPQMQRLLSVGYVSTGYVPMVNGAIYGVRLEGGRLIARTQ